MLEIDKLETLCSYKAIPPVGWALANIICLATRSENDFVDSLDYSSYVLVVITLAENFLAWLDNVGWIKKNQDTHGNIETSAADIDAVSYENETICGSLNMTYMDLLRPVCEQWHLIKLLEIAKMGASFHGAETLLAKTQKYVGKLESLNIAYFYSYMLKIFLVFNPVVGSLPVLNLLSFTPGYLVNIWGELEDSLFLRNERITEDISPCTSKTSMNKKDVLEKIPKQTSKDGANKLVNALHKFTGKSQAQFNTDIVGGQSKPAQVD